MTRHTGLEFPEPARLDIEHVTAGYNGSDALSDLTLQIPHGSQVAIVGPNGAGKSTLFKVLVGLLPLRKGNIQIHCKPIGQHRDCIAYIPQREEVDWKFPVTVRDVVTMGRYAQLGWFAQPGSQDSDVVDECLKQMNLLDLADASVGDLSGGQQQRVFLARALAQEPHILLMDEPFTGVDAATLETTLAIIKNLRQNKVTVLVSTHDLNLAAQHFELVILLNKRLISFGPPEKSLTQETLKAAFGQQLVNLDGAYLVDDCCPPDEDRHLRGDHA
ncbi:MAG: metal ABC transporter ATP-binding protein [Anaerolineaceae bacterium]